MPRVTYVSYHANRPLAPSHGSDYHLETKTIKSMCLHNRLHQIVPKKKSPRGGQAGSHNAMHQTVNSKQFAQLESESVYTSVYFPSVGCCVDIRPFIGEV